MDRIHCLVVGDPDTGQLTSYHGDTLSDGLQRLAEASELLGHNIIGFDIPAIQIVYPNWKPKGRIRDTLIISRLIWSDLKEHDFRAMRTWPKRKGKKYPLPGKLTGSHGLEAWGHRLGFHKGDYKKEMEAKGLDPWAEFNDDMLSYCENDVDLNMDFLSLIERKAYSEQAIELEHRVFLHCQEQVKRGCSFDAAAAVNLYAELCEERSNLERELRDTFGAWYAKDQLFVPKRDNKKMGYVAGTKLTKIKLVEFNPGSRDHIANRLMKVRGWKPKKFTKGGKPQVDETTLSGLRWPEAKLAARYLLVQKRIGQIAEGKQAWLKFEKEGRIHGQINPMGTVTGRCAHFRPNLGQVPASRSPWGPECRAMFRATPGWVFVGGDASGLELRCMGHYLARWDDGEYATAVVNGNSDDQTDAHSLTAKALGYTDVHAPITIRGKTSTGRDVAKTFIYALIYGAGDAKLGEIVGKGRKAGKDMRARFMAALPALASLVSGVQRKVAKTSAVRGLDGRIIPVESDHAALNYLLQGAGAIVMKQALVNWHELLAEKGLVLGKDYHQVLWVHDEFQAECRPGLEDTVGQAIVDAIVKAGEDLGFRCPLDGEYKVGPNWAATH